MAKDGALTGQALQDYKNAWNVQNGINGERGGSQVVPTAGGTSTMGSAVGAFPSGGGTPSYSTQAAALRNPDPITSETPVNPGQADALNRAKNYESGVASGTNEETVRELGRARDEISVGMKREGEAAMSRGADPSLFRNRALGAGARNLSNLQGRLADVSLGRRAEAVGLVGSRADAAAGEQRLTNFSSISAQLDANRGLREQAETQARLQEAPYNRLTTMLQNVGNYRDAFGALGAPSVTSGGGFVSSPAPAPVSGGYQNISLGRNPTGANVIGGLRV